jgi:molecular chaperone DnaK
MNKAIGIDLGTTSSRVAVVRDQTPVIIENAEGEGTTPSHVAITPSGGKIVGKAARRYALKDPSNVFFSVKRLLGRRFDDPVVQELPGDIDQVVLVGEAIYALQDN